MKLFTKIIVAGVALTAVTGSLAWVNTAKDVGSAVVETVSDSVSEAVQDYIEENYMDEDGNIVIPEDDIAYVVEKVKSYMTLDNLQALCDAAALDIDVYAVADGDYTTLATWITNGQLVIPTSD